MNRGFIYILIISLFFSCHSKIENGIDVEVKTDTLEKGKIRITELKRIYKGASDTLIAEITSINNQDDDLKTLYLTGISSKDGMKEWLMDSLFYDIDDFDTIQLSYKSVGNEWQKNQVFKRKYDDNNNLEYFVTERFNKPGFKIEEFLKYNSSNQIVSKTRYECEVSISGCDSVYKDLYYYNKEGVLDSMNMLIWKNDNWEKFKRKSR